jgi:hypothetical protein|tara:strand:+ start:106 stop:291 length:186 start_codon:yes stop_codon:yes gene_type:complete
MRLNELIKKLKAIKKLHGNLNVIFYSLENYNLEEIYIETILAMEEDNRLEITFEKIRKEDN